MQKRTLLPIVTIILLINSLFISATAQQVFKTTPQSVIGYLEYVPADYHSNSNKYPIVIFLHGIGERGTDSTDPAVLESSITTVANLGPPKHVKTGTQFPFILISPQLKKNFGTWPSWYVMEVINHVKTYLRVDERRIHITGLSLGGGGAWVVAQDYPQQFASLSPVCGGYNSTSKACGIASENLPVWAFHGDKDTIVPLSRSVNMVNAINACVPAPSPQAKMTIYEGVAHNAWDRAYPPDHSYHNPTVYEWMMSYTNTINNGNSIPIANAGSDRTATTSTSSVTINGSATDKENAVTSYSWTQLSGPSAALTGTNTTSLKVTNLTQGVYIFRFQVTDQAGLTDSDYVKLTVSPNVLPVANAGADKVISLPTTSTVITGSGTDADGSVASYSWSKISGGAASLSGSTTSVLTVSNLTAGTYTFRLTVRDNAGGSHYDDVKVFVNQPPTVSAGADFSITLPTNSLQVTGAASDADGTIVSYNWTMTTGTIASLSGTATATLSATGLVEGYYVFRLKVKDNNGASKFDDIKITVRPNSALSSVANTPPVAYAGADKVITLPTNAITLQGMATDTDGTIASYSWSKVSGDTATLSGQSTSSFTASGLEAGTYTFRLTAKDNGGAIHSDDVTIVVNMPPVVSVGKDFSLQLPTTSLTITGDASDPDGSIVAYTWLMTTGTAATLSGTNTPELKASGLVEGYYVFRLKVRDNHGAVKFDDVKITVKPALSAAPVVNAGDDVNLLLPWTTATLYGNAIDQDGGSIVSYKWTKVAGGAANLSGASTPKLTAWGLANGSYVFRLTAIDDEGESQYDDVKVVVTNAPVADAGPDVELALPWTTAKLYGGGTDPDGTIAAYDWTIVSGGAANLSGASTPTLTAWGLTEGTYVFRLTVRDNHGALAFDEVTLNVVAPTSASSFSENVEMMSDTPVAENVLKEKTTAYWLNKTVVLYDGSGKKIFEGKWSQERYHELLGQGLYICNIISEGNNVSQEKIFIR